MSKIIPIPLNFDLAVSPEKKVTRQVCAFAIQGKDLCLIDTGTAANKLEPDKTFTSGTCEYAISFETCDFGTAIYATLGNVTLKNW